MESHSLPMKIHCSARFEQVLKQQVPGIHLQPRGMTPIKGKGLMETFFVDDEKYEVRKLPFPSSNEWQYFLSVIAPKEGVASTQLPSVSDEWQQFLSIIAPDPSVSISDGCAILDSFKESMIDHPRSAEREPSQSQPCD